MKISISFGGNFAGFHSFSVFCLLSLAQGIKARSAIIESDQFGHVSSAHSTFFDLDQVLSAAEHKPLGLHAAILRKVGGKEKKRQVPATTPKGIVCDSKVTVLRPQGNC